MKNLKTDDYDTVEDVSGAPWPGAEMVSRPRAITPPRPGHHMSPRRQRMIDATSGETLDAELAKGLTAAAERRLSIRRAVDQASAGREMLRHLFGLNLPGRDRA
jgi:hypothetical protein